MCVSGAARSGPSLSVHSDRRAEEVQIFTVVSTNFSASAL